MAQGDVWRASEKGLRALSPPRTDQSQLSNQSRTEQDQHDAMESLWLLTVLSIINMNQNNQFLFFPL